MRDRVQIDENRQKIRQIILNSLSKQAMYRKELHKKCCRELGKSDDLSDKPSRICKDMPDSWFDVPLRELYDLKILRKERKGKFMYYELVNKI